MSKNNGLEASLPDNKEATQFQKLIEHQNFHAQSADYIRDGVVIYRPETFSVLALVFIYIQNDTVVSVMPEDFARRHAWMAKIEQNSIAKVKLLVAVVVLKIKLKLVAKMSHTIFSADRRILLSFQNKSCYCDLTHCNKKAVKPKGFVLKKVVTLGVLLGSKNPQNLAGIQSFLSTYDLNFGHLNVLIMGASAEEINLPTFCAQHISEYQNLDGFYEKIDALFCPMSFSSGVTTKALEATLYGKPVITSNECRLPPFCQHNRSIFKGSFVEIYQLVKNLSGLNAWLEHALRDCAALQRTVETYYKQNYASVRDNLENLPQLRLLK